MSDPQQIVEDLRNTFRGRLAFDALTRGIYSTDASPFQVTPLGVAVPLDTEDLSVLVRYCAENAISLIPRGAGTGLAGEALGPGLIVDLSVHFRKILKITTDSATVETGVGLEELNEKLAPLGRRFAPDPASGGSCTLGGMVATNASGGNAFRHGYTRDYITRLEVVWDIGEASSVAGPSSSDTSDQVESQRTRDIQAATTSLLRNHRDLIHLSRPLTAYNRCGYLLHDVLTPSGTDVVKLMCGSEGTLGFITAATLRTIPLPGGVAFTLLGFATLDAAIRAGLDLRATGALSCDLLDRRLLTVTRQPRVGQPSGLIPPLVGAALVISFEEDTQREALSRANSAIDSLRDTHRLVVLVEPTCEPEGIARVRSVRTTAVSGLYGLGRGPRPVAFIEDVGVPAEVVPEFIAQVQDVLKRFEMTGSFLAHPLTGQVHTRPLVDLENPADRAKLWPIAELVHEIALNLGGTVSTQHATGIARTPWVEKQYGPILPVFREIKRIFDPKGILNPGKIIGPDPSRPAWPLREFVVANAVEGEGTSPTESRPPSVVSESNPSEVETSVLAGPLLLWADTTPVAEARKCTGCGDCRSNAGTSRMCPVFRATGREESSPRAKTNVLRLINDPISMGTEEIAEVSAGCINCRMCRDECPARVDVSKLMLEAKAARHAENGMERTDWVFARAEWLAGFGSNLAPLVNGLLSRPPARWLFEKLFGVSRSRRLPAFAMRTFFRRAKRQGLMRKPPNIEQNFTQATPREKVAYFVDTFANYNDPLIGTAAVAVLRHNGVEVYVPPRQVGCGMSALAEGDVETARETASQNIRVLSDLVREGYRVVCSEPTAALMLSQDYPTLFNNPDTAALSANTVELTTYLWELHAVGKLRTDFRRLDVTLGHHVPCHIKALHGPAVGPRLLDLIPGVTTRTIDVSCSGMGGLWGLRATNAADSLIAGKRMLDELNRPGVLFGSTECSTCRLQMQEGTGKRTLHPVQYLAYAYGLLPEIETKLRRPLSDLVSD